MPKLGIVVEAADESVGWLELMARVALDRGPDFTWLLGAAKELLSYIAKS